MSTPIKLSDLKPTEGEVENVRRHARWRFAHACTLGDLEEAIGNRLSEKHQAILMRTVQKLYRTTGNHSMGDLLLVGALVSAAFRAHVEKWAAPAVLQYVDRYADRKADELREQGYNVEGWA